MANIWPETTTRDIERAMRSLQANAKQYGGAPQYMFMGLSALARMGGQHYGWTRRTLRRIDGWSGLSRKVKVDAYRALREGQNSVTL